MLLNSSRSSDARRPNQSSIPLRNRCNRCECLAAQFHVKESHDSLFVIVYHISDLRVVTMPEAERNRFMRSEHARRDALKEIEISFRVHPELWLLTSHGSRWGINNAHFARPRE